MTAYHVKIRNTGKAARVIHDGAKPVRVEAGATLDAILTEDTIKLIEAERHDHDSGEEPRLEVERGEKAEELGDAHPPLPHQQQASTLGGEEIAPAPKRGPPHK